jgi:hypothetical protein
MWRKDYVNGILYTLQNICSQNACVSQKTRRQIEGKAQVNQNAATSAFLKFVWRKNSAF